jgi:hypothetical protein
MPTTTQRYRRTVAGDVFGADHSAWLQYAGSPKCQKRRLPIVVNRTANESVRLIDRLVGRCVREPGFAAAVLANPDVALCEYELSQDELDDFRVLSARDHGATLSGWARLHDVIEDHRRAMSV